ncbi:hypothetical protein [Trinickia fusca]|nr:hypothetical protein [Trinickia fusca]
MLAHPSLDFPVRRMMRVARERVAEPQPRIALVSVDIAVPATASNAARRALHETFGAALRLYVVTTDKSSDSVTFRIEVTGHTLDEVLSALTRALPAATLGRAGRGTPPSLRLT